MQRLSLSCILKEEWGTSRQKPAFWA